MDKLTKSEIKDIFNRLLPRMNSEIIDYIEGNIKEIEGANMINFKYGIPFNDIKKMYNSWAFYNYGREFFNTNTAKNTFRKNKDGSWIMKQKKLK